MFGVFRATDYENGRNPPMKLLIIEDDKEIAGLLAVYLKKNGYDVTERYDGVAGLNELRAHTEDYGMILLDMMLPGFSGNELLPRFREITNIPVIVISAVSNLDERIGMMRSGADDYIIKPFELPDVLVRIEAVARRYSLQLRGGEGDGREGTGGKTTDRNGRTGRTGRTGGTGGSGRKPLSYGTITLDTESAQVTVKGEPLGLTTKEYEILRLFMENPTKLFSKANLFESVWNEEYYPEDQALKVHMSNLRSKLRKMDDFDYIETVWGMGYRLRKLG
jgi:DNA-binding response OmpR family regulator